MEYIEDKKYIRRKSIDTFVNERKDYLLDILKKESGRNIYLLLQATLMESREGRDIFQTDYALFSFENDDKAKKYVSENYKIVYGKNKIGLVRLALTSSGDLDYIPILYSD
ncbi:MAG: hypothetical protein QW641_01030 [Candidatus Aenigmatarchaeota archaeon]